MSNEHGQDQDWISCRVLATFGSGLDWDIHFFLNWIRRGSGYFFDFYNEICWDIDCQKSGLLIQLFWSKVLEFWLFWKPFAGKKNRQITGFFHLERLDSGKTLSELHIHYKSFLMRVYEHAEYTESWKGLTVPLKIIDVIHKKQAYDSAITGKKVLLKIGIVLYRCFWRVITFMLCLFVQVLCVYSLKLLPGFI